MDRVTSRDGTGIAFDKLGEGPPVVLVWGALTTRASGSKLAQLLAPRLTVYNYDRRGKGDSGDTEQYALAREIEDIDALIDHAGAPANLFGHSSGAALALDASLELGDRVRKLAMYEAPYNDDQLAVLAWKDYVAELTELLAADRRGDAVARFMRLLGTPAAQIEHMRQAPMWPALEALAPTMAYDHTAIMGPEGSVPLGSAAHLRIPALVMNGDQSQPFMAVTALALSEMMPHGRHLAFQGQGHAIDPEVLAPVLLEFFS